MTGVTIASITVLSSTCPRRLHAAVPGRQEPAAENRHEHRRDDAEHDRADDHALAVLGCEGFGAGGRHQMTSRKPSMYPIVCIGPPKPSIQPAAQGTKHCQR